FAHPPSLTSCATPPAKAAVRGPHVPIMSGTERRRGSYSRPVPGASEKRSPAQPDRSPARSRRTISTAPPHAVSGRPSSRPSRAPARRTRRAACPTGARARALRQVLRRQHALPDPLDPHHDPLVGVGAADERVLLEPVVLGKLSLLRGQERQHALQRVEAEVP